MPELKLAIDAMGGDNGPSVVLEALKNSLKQNTTTQFVVVGDETILSPLLTSSTLSSSLKSHCVHAEQVVEMTDKPGATMRQKPQSSMRIALDMHAHGEVDGVVSGGNTGALMAQAYFI